MQWAPRCVLGQEYELVLPAASPQHSASTMCMPTEKRHSHGPLVRSFIQHRLPAHWPWDDAQARKTQFLLQEPQRPVGEGKDARKSRRRYSQC